MHAPKPNPHLMTDPEHAMGQVLALRALVLALADLTTTSQAFATRGSASLERLRAAVLPSSAADGMLDAIDQTERWLRQATGER